MKPKTPKLVRMPAPDPIESAILHIGDDAFLLTASMEEIEPREPAPVVPIRMVRDSD